jgi:hypothetical protein
MRPEARIRQLAHQRLVHQITFDGRFEDLSRKLCCIDLLTLYINDVYFHQLISE